MHIRRLSASDELDAASRLEAAIWGAPDPTPRSLLVVFSHHGGVVLGAYDGLDLVGVTVGFPGIDHRARTYLHSHLLGVLPPYRCHRLGEALKRAQWAFAEERQLPYIGWTYDPLMAPNAWFNLAVLGARVADVWEDVYGALQDELNYNLKTHRLWVEWNPTRPNLAVVSSVVGLSIPAGVSLRRQQNPELASQEADRFFSQIQELWDAGLRIVGVTRDDSGVAYQWAPERDGNAYED